MFLGLSGYRPVTAFIAPFIFISVFGLLVGGFLPYSYMFLTSFSVVLFISFRSWLIRFLYLISTEQFARLLIKKGHSLPINIFMFPIELVGIVIKPLSLAIRLYANLIFGHYIILFRFYYVIRYLGVFGYFLLVPLFLLELFVFFIQRFVFTYLVCIYFEE